MSKIPHVHQNCNIAKYFYSIEPHGTYLTFYEYVIINLNEISDIIGKFMVVNTGLVCVFYAFMLLCIVRVLAFRRANIFGENIMFIPQLR